MGPKRPKPISESEKSARREQIGLIAKRLGFVGLVEYRHIFSRSGGAQFGLAVRPEFDRLTVFAEAFDRVADPNDFSLEAIIAHECGHQLLHRHPRLAQQVSGKVSDATEEILASILGAILCSNETDSDALVTKATAELLARGEAPAAAVRQIHILLKYLEQSL